MTTETKVAKKLIKKKNKGYVVSHELPIHFASLKRELVFLEECLEDVSESCHFTIVEVFVEKLKDIKEAIKLYEEIGLK